MGDGETPAFLLEPRGLTRGAQGGLGCERSLGCVPGPAGAAAPVSWAPPAPRREALASRCCLATLCSALALALSDPRSCWAVIWEGGSYTSARVREGHRQRALWKRFC